ncbi:MAG: DUF4926 domain-containing protein [Myxococcales bacterium]|nr:DUF4926 domain-containing protein [Myxococcales bacterium]
MTLHEYDVVRLLRPLPEHGLSKGATGAVVMVFDNPRAYEVEFCDAEGVTLALVTLEEQDLERVAQA